MTGETDMGILDNMGSILIDTNAGISNCISSMLASDAMQNLDDKEDEDTQEIVEDGEDDLLEIVEHEDDEDLDLDIKEVDEYEPTAEEVADVIKTYEADHPKPPVSTPINIDIKQTARDMLMAFLKDKGGLKNAIKLMQKTETGKAMTQRMKAKQFRFCDVVTTCDHCGRMKRRTVTLETKTESFSYIAEDKHVVIVTFDTIEKPCTFLARVSFCDKCGDYVKYMSREDLEAKYMLMLRRIIK